MQISFWAFPASMPAAPHIYYLHCLISAMWLSLGLLVVTSPVSGANLFTNASFESGTWGGSQSFVDPNNATTLFNSSSTLTGWTTVIGSTWVQDTTRATDANRMLWLGPPSVGAWDCASQKVSLFSSGDPSLQLVANNRYNLLVDYSFFDPNDPTAALVGLSSFTAYYVLGTNAGGDDPFSQTTLFTNTGSVSNWNALQWNQASISFDLPNIAGYDYIKFFLSAPKATASVQSRGVLIDNASLSLVPEPGSLILCGTLLGLAAHRRRRVN